MIDLIDQPKQGEYLKVRIVSSKGQIFSGYASSISSANSNGSFDLLPRHIDFLTLVQNSPIIIRTLDNKTVKFNLPLSIIHASKNNITVYTDLYLKLE